MSAVCNPVLETPEIKYSVQPGCGFLSEGYYKATYNSKTKRGQVHPAIDLNAVTGGDTDYGNRVRAIAEGVVVAAGQYPSWGGIVLIHHPELGVWSQSAHLINIRVKAGDHVHLGDIIGQIGKGANEQFWAHLHFEIRRNLLPADFWPSSRFPGKAGAEAYIREHYLDPEKWLEEHQALRTLAEVEQERRSWAQPPVVAPRPEVPAAPSVHDIPPTPRGQPNPLQAGVLIPLFGPSNDPLYTASGVPVTHIKLQRRTLQGLETQYKAVAVLGGKDAQ